MWIAFFAHIIICVCVIWCFISLQAFSFQELIYSNEAGPRKKRSHRLIVAYLMFIFICLCDRALR